MTRQRPPITRRASPGRALFAGAVALGLLGWLAAAATARARQEPPAAPATRPLRPEEQQLVGALRAEQVHLDPRRGLCWIPVDVCIRDELLEYLLVGPAGASHEALLQTPVRASVLNTALLALGAAPGTNAQWRPKEPRPSDDEMRSGVSPYDVELPQGTGFHLYLAWRQERELYCYRVEDLVRNLLKGHSMQRHAWVYLGSRMLPRDPNRKPSADPQSAPVEVFAADIYQNLINISFFHDGLTLLTGALPECVEQTIWMPNAWLVPERGTRLALVFALAPFDVLPPEIVSELPAVDPAERDSRREREEHR